MQRLLVTRYDPMRAASNESLSLEDISELLGLLLLVPFPIKSVPTSTNLGQPVIVAGDASERTRIPSSDSWGKMSLSGSSPLKPKASSRVLWRQRALLDN